MMVQLVKTYIIMLLFFLVADAVWMAGFAIELFQRHLGHILAPQVNFLPVILFYLIYVAGVIVLAVRPAWASASGKTALLLGSMLGLVAYGTYDLTNWALIRDWPAIITVMDMVWGTCLTGTASLIGYLVGKNR